MPVTGPQKAVQPITVAEVSTSARQRLQALSPRPRRRHRRFHRGLTQPPRHASPCLIYELLFQDAAAWHAWLDIHHAAIRAYGWCSIKRAVRRQRLVYAQAVDEALCFGWIDGQIARRDDESYQRR